MRSWKQGSNGGRTYFLYDGAAPVCELDSSGSVTATNTFGGSGLLSRHTANGSTFYTFDERGNVAQRLNAAGTPTSSAMYDAYGASASAAPDPFGFGGQFGYYTDSETGLQLCQHRYYDSNVGRFITRDPAGYAGGLNLYAYCANNPVTSADPSGFNPQNDGGDGLTRAGSFFGGFGRSVGLGWLYDLEGLNGVVDRHPGWEVGGEVTGTVVAALATDGGSTEAQTEGVALMKAPRFLRGKVASLGAAKEQLAAAGLKLRQVSPEEMSRLYGSEAAAAFDANSGVVLTENATKYQLFHEMAHFEHFQEIGRDAFIDLTKSDEGEKVLEEHVYQKIMNNQELFNSDELEHATNYITHIRNL